MRCRFGEIELGRRKVMIRSFGEMKFEGVESGFKKQMAFFEELKVEKKQL